MDLIGFNLKILNFIQDCRFIHMTTETEYSQNTHNQMLDDKVTLNSLFFFCKNVKTFEGYVHFSLCVLWFFVAAAVLSGVCIVFE